MSESSWPPVDNSSVAPWSAFCTSRISILDGVTAYSDATTVESSRLKLDQELEALRVSMHTIQSRRNALAPITRLHPEILAHIFSFLAAEEIPRKMIRRFRPRGFPAPSPILRLGWMRVTHVCQAWRKAALDTPSLWGIDVDSMRDCTSERLRRSKQAPLVVRYFQATDRLAPEEQDVLKSLLSQTHRARELELTCSPDHVTKNMANLLTVRAPLLESFVYSAPMYPAGASCILPANIFAANAPRLRKLMLADAKLPLQSPLYDNLTHLAMNTREHNPVSGLAFSRDELLGLLRRTLNLETLELAYSIPAGGSTSADAPMVVDDSMQSSTDLAYSSPMRVSLPCLKKIKLCGEPADCLWISEHLDIPADAALHLHCTERQPADQDHLSARVALVPLIARHAGGAPLRSLFLMDYARSLEITAWTTAYTPDLRLPMARMGEPVAQVHVRLTANRMRAPVDAAGTMRRFCAAVPKDALEAVYLLVGNGSFDRGAWAAQFALARAVERVSVSGMGAASFACALNAYVDAPTGPGAEDAPDAARALFPALRRLQLHRVPFSRRVTQDAADTIGDIVQAAIARRRALPGNRVEELQVGECQVAQAHIDALRGMFGAGMEWDGRGTEQAAQPGAGGILDVPGMQQLFGTMPPGAVPMGAMAELMDNLEWQEMEGGAIGMGAGVMLAPGETVDLGQIGAFQIDGAVG